MSLFSMGSILDPRFLSASYTKKASLAEPGNAFFNFYDAKAAEVQSGDYVEMVVFDDARTLAPVGPRGAPAKTMDLEGASKKYFRWIHAFNEIGLSAASCEFLRQPDGTELQNRGMQEIGRQFEQFGKKHRNTRIVTLAKSFSGNVYYDAAGQILEDSTGAAISIDHGVGATHKSQLAHASNASTDIIGTAWDQAGASILTDLDQIVVAAEYDKVPRPRHVWLPYVGKQWLRNNTEFKDYVKYANLPRIEEMLRGDDPIEVNGFMFHFVNTTYTGADGSTVRSLIPVDKAIITPDVNDGMWFRHFEGTETVPTGDGVVSSLADWTSNTTTVEGDFAYARIMDNPLKLALRMGMNFFYGFSDPNAVWYPTVDF